MSTYVPGFQSFSNILHHFVLVKLATSCIRVKLKNYCEGNSGPLVQCLKVNNTVLFPSFNHKSFSLILMLTQFQK